jgi:hypothetical protein
MEVLVRELRELKRFSRNKTRNYDRDSFISFCSYPNMDPGAGLPDVFFLNQKSQFGRFLRALDWKMLIYFMAIWNLLQTFGIFYDHFGKF